MDIETGFEGSRQLNVPLSKDLFKVISRHKNGFSLGILNIRTLDRLTIVHTPAHPITLDTLLAYDLGMSDLYDRLATQIYCIRVLTKRVPTDHH